MKCKRDGAHLRANARSESQHQRDFPFTSTIGAEWKWCMNQDKLAGKYAVDEDDNYSIPSINIGRNGCIIQSGDSSSKNSYV